MGRDPISGRSDTNSNPSPDPGTSHSPQLRAASGGPLRLPLCSETSRERDRDLGDQALSQYGRRMTTRNTSLILCALVLLGTFAACRYGTDDGIPAPIEPPALSADGLIIENARVFTADDAQPWASAVALRGAQIVYVGDATGAAAALNGSPTIWDADGRAVTPGFFDPHLHVPEAGLNEALCLLDPFRTASQYARDLARCASRTEGEWVRAAGATLSEIDSRDGSPLALLDAAVPDRPVLVLDDLGHAVWTNTLGLQAASIGADEGDPPGGVFARDPQTNDLTGLLLENAQLRVRDVALQSDAALDAGLAVALQRLAEQGVTSVSDAGGYWRQGHLAAWQRAAGTDDLTVRASNALYLYPDADLSEQVETFRSLYANDPAARLRINTIKVYLDGILDLGTALLVEPYAAAPNASYPRGFAYFEQDALLPALRELHAIGFQFHFHTVGDGAVRQALDLVEALHADFDDVAARRHRTTHNYLIHPDDVPRFAQLGVVVDFQFGEGTDQEYVDYLTPILGIRAQRLLPVGDAIEAGAHVTLSSDWDADILGPMGIIARSVGRSPQAVSDVEAAVRLMTRSPAELFGQSDQLGVLRAGTLADVVVLDADIFSMSPSEIGDVPVAVTIVGGEVVFARRDLSAAP